MVTSNNKSVVVPLGFIGITGSQTATKIDFFPQFNPNDAISFTGGDPALTPTGRAGTGFFNWGSGAFSVATGSINYNFSCTGFCFDGNGSPVYGFFIWTLSCNISLTMQTALANAIFPNTAPTPAPAPTSTPSGGTADDYAGQAGVTTLINSTPASQHIRQQKDAAAASSGDAGSLSLDLPLQPVDFTYVATAACPSLPTGCWLTVPAASGTVSAFSETMLTLALTGKLSGGTLSGAKVAGYAPSPLVIFGSTSQNGIWYSGEPGVASAHDFGSKPFPNQLGGGAPDFIFPVFKLFRVSRFVIATDKGLRDIL